MGFDPQLTGQLKKSGFSFDLFRKQPSHLSAERTTPRLSQLLLTDNLIGRAHDS